MHWSDEKLLERLYGVDGQDKAPTVEQERHLAECGECHARWVALRARRAAALEASRAEGPDEAVAAQARRLFWSRLEARRRWLVKPWIGPAAAGAMLAAVLLVVAPAWRQEMEPPQEHLAPGSDAGLFGELTAISAPDYLSVAEPVRGLFEPPDEGAEELD